MKMCSDVIRARLPPLVILLTDLVDCIRDASLFHHSSNECVPVLAVTELTAQNSRVLMLGWPI